MALLGSKNNNQSEQSKDVFHYPTSKNALIIFTRNPELGKCKTRLAKTVGDEAALSIYKFLLAHTVKVTTPLNADKYVFYSEKVRTNDVWNETVFRKKQQTGTDLGQRMQSAFEAIFNMGYERAIIIGSDLYDITTNDLNNAFEALKNSDYVIGPAEDGGYYLLGMKAIFPTIFKNKTWGTATVLKNTLENLKNKSVTLLSEKNDVDYFEDIKDVDAFKPFFPEHLINTTE